jgi:hypothetical protein
VRRATSGHLRLIRQRRLSIRPRSRVQNEIVRLEALHESIKITKWKVGEQEGGSSA